VVGYSRAQALAERAVLPVTFGALDGEASWRDEEVEIGPHRLSAPFSSETTRPALFTALRTGFAEALLRAAFVATRDLRARRREARGLPAGIPARGPGKLLVVAPDQAAARHYLEVVHRWIPPPQAEVVAQLATSDSLRAHEVLAAFRLRPEPSVLVTVAMTYEGLDAPEVAVVAALTVTLTLTLTHIRSRSRSRSWLEQMVARATRVDPQAGRYEDQRALVFHPDDPLFAGFRRRKETEQGTLARRPKEGRRQSSLPSGCCTSCRRPRRASPPSPPTPWPCATTRSGPGQNWPCAAPKARRPRARCWRRPHSPSGACGPASARWSRSRPWRTRRAGRGAAPASRDQGSTTATTPA
jgi:hypothetical protein